MSKREQVQSCFKIINDFCIENRLSISTNKLLDRFLGNYLQIRRTPTTAQMKLMLDRLVSLAGKDEKLIESIVIKTIECGWATFYPVSNNYSFDNVPKGAISKNNKEVILANEEF